MKLRTWMAVGIGAGIGYGAGTGQVQRLCRQAERRLRGDGFAETAGDVPDAFGTAVTTTAQRASDASMVDRAESPS
jgi:hypothetical protein